MTTMKKWIALLLTLTLLLSFTACMGGTDKPDATDPDDTGASAELTENGSAADPSAAFDVGSLNWVDGELDCYGYKAKGEDCYLSFRRPESCTAVEHDNSGEQYRGYYFHPENPDATYACLNFGEAFCPEAIRERSLLLDGDIGEILSAL